LVTKYYVKHINSGEVFLGEQWDGDDNWNDALKNHLNNLMEKLGDKK
jgi:DNA-directed RNA polymerase subunit L